MTWAAFASLATSGRGAPAPEVNLRRTVVVEVVQRTKDAVVNISTTKLVDRRVAGWMDDFFLSPGSGGGIARVPANSLGSGFIVHPDGYVVTNNHVVDRARQIVVEIADGRKFDAELISADSEADLAILRIKGDAPFPTLHLGDSSDLLIGEPVIAVGNPLGYSHSVSTGIVSAVHRDLKDNAGRVTLGDLIQTDAAINPGNSGGPLLNAYGQVIGINTAVRGDAQNIGFSIQVNRLRELIPELMNPSQVTKVDVGVKLTEARTLTPPATVQSRVLRVNGEQRTGIAAINGTRPRDIVDAYAMLLRCKAGDRLALQTEPAPGGKPATEQVTCSAVPQPDAIVQARKRLGLGIEPLTPILAERYRVAADDGLFVSEVLKGSVSERAGVKPGDVVLSLGRYRVSGLSDFSALLQHLPETGRVRIGILRGDQVGYGMLEFEQAEGNGQ